MRIDETRKSVDMEERDINYVLSSYVRLYLFQTRNQDPEVITFPMFKSVPHPYKPGVKIPVEYAPDISPIAIEITQDGADIPETTPEAEAEADEREDNYLATKARLAEVEAELAKLKADKKEPVEEQPISPARAAFAKVESEPSEVVVDPPTPERLAKAKMPDNPLPPGTQSDYGGRRDPRDSKRIARDLIPEKEINEEEEKEDTELVDRAKGKKES